MNVGCHSEVHSSYFPLKRSCSSSAGHAPSLSARVLIDRIKRGDKDVAFLVAVNKRGNRPGAGAGTIPAPDVPAEDEPMKKRASNQQKTGEAGHASRFVAMRD
jgi:hypothetical protein